MTSLSEAQQAAVDARGVVLVSAGAGSGKTTMLVERAVREIENGVDPESVFVVTFTERAASELAERMRARLQSVGLQALAERISVSTIHSLCGSILREHAFALGLDPEFRVLDEASAGIIRGEALEQALTEAAASDDGATLDLLAAFGGAALRQLVVRLRDRRLSCGLDLAPDPPAAGDLDEARAALAVLAQLAVAHYAGADPSENSDRAERLAAFLPGATVETLVDLSPFQLKRAPAALAAFKPALERTENAARAELARLLHPQIIGLVQRFDRVFAARKSAAAALDFADLELRARDLLVGDADARAAVQERVRHLLVDEFQDTNALQDSILDLIAGDDAERVYVGDERQSIYRFRDADVEVFRRRREEARTVVRLDDCYRSSDALVGTLNEVFGSVFGADFQRLIARGSAPSPEDGVAVELIVVDEVGGIGAAREREASVLAARLAELRELGHAQSEMVVLLRVSTDADLYEAALQQAGFETHRTIGGGYYGRQQVSDLCAYLRLLRSRYDDRALLTVLASPLIGVSNPGLYALRRAAQTALFRGLEYGLPDGLSEDDARLMRAFRQRFDRLVDAAQQLGIADLLERIVSEHDYDLACLAQPDGRRRYANVRKLIRLARDYEALRGPDLAGFLALVGTLADLATQEPEAALAEEEVDAVRILTVHAAKGLEFDVVALADAGREPNLGVAGLLAPADGRLAFQVPSPGGKLVAPPLFEQLKAREHAAELAEAERLVYVAMTRARERLIVSGGITARTSENAPLRFVARALGLELDSMPAGSSIEQGGEGSLVRVLIERSAEDDEATDAQDPPVVSVYQLALSFDDLTDPEPPALPALHALEPLPVAPRHVPRSLSFTALALHERCPYRYLAERELGLAPVARAGVGDGSAHGLSALEIGSAVHAVLEGRPGLDLEVLLGAAVGAEDRARIEAFASAFEGSLLATEIAATGDALREQPFAFTVDGVVFRGVLDVLVRRSDGSMLVVDYKTTRLGDRSPDELVAEEYELQRQAYALALLGGGATAVDVAFAFLERPELVSRTSYLPGDEPALRAAVEAAVERLRHSGFAPRPSPRVCGDCGALDRICAGTRLG
ncbi:MAG: UvrD-helicase domain-containing protein [Gaiellales bacterium]